MDGCALIVLLTADTINLRSNDSNNDRLTCDPVSEEALHIGATSIGPWNTAALVEFLASTALGFSDSLAFDTLIQKTHEVLQCLRGAPQLSDVDEAGNLKSTTAVMA